MAPSPECVQPLCILLFTDFAQIESQALVPLGSILEEKVGCVGVGLKIGVSQAISHDEGDRVVTYRLGSRVESNIHLALRVGGCKDSVPAGILEILGIIRAQKSLLEIRSGLTLRWSGFVGVGL